MKIAAVDSWVLQYPYHPAAADTPMQVVDVIGVDLTTEDGTHGMGFTYSLCGGAAAIKALIDDLFGPLVVGQSLEDRERIWHTLWWKTRRLGAGVTMLALAALDIALWDSVARVAGVPLARLLGAQRDGVPAFASGTFSPALDVDTLVRNAAIAVEQGFTALKIRIGGTTPEADLVRLQAVRRAIGDQVRLMCDAAELYTLPDALWMCPRLEDLQVYWFEEPLPAEDVAGHAHLQARTTVAIAVGEHLFDRFRFTEYLRADAASIYQPDAAILGGVSEFRRVAQLTEAHGRPIAPHLVTDLHVSLAAAAPNAIYVEHFPFTDHLWQQPIIVRDGVVLVPDRPGHGLELAPDVVRRYRIA